MTRWWMCALVTSALLWQPGVWAQQRLANAKALYLEADYEQALKLFGELTVAEAPADETHHYRALCLLALGRLAEAEEAMSAAVQTNPFFVPSAADVSPRVSRMYADLRQQLLPRIARRLLTEARERHQDGEHERALEGFDSVLKLLADPSLATRDDLADLRLAADGLAELARTQARALMARVATAASAPAPTTVDIPPPVAGTGAGPFPAAASPTPSEAVRPSVEAPRDEAATPAGSAAPRPAGAEAPDSSPVPISQTLPRWTPPDQNVARRSFSGAIRVSVDASGAVIGARMERSVFPSYDRLLLEAARAWRYRPALRAGAPVNGDIVVEIQLRPAAD
jgi:protein TonB